MNVNVTSTIDLTMSICTFNFKLLKLNTLCWDVVVHALCALRSSCVFTETTIAVLVVVLVLVVLLVDAVCFA